MATSGGNPYYTYKSHGDIHELLRCPYDQFHIVGASKFPNHLVRCRKRHPEIAKKMSICNYNQSHHVLTEDMSLHITVCQDYKAHVFHSLNTCKPSFLPPELHKNLAESVNPDNRQPAKQELVTFTKEELDDWM